MTTRALLLLCCCLLSALPLPAQEAEEKGGLFERAGKMWKSSGADKLVEDYVEKPAGDLAGRVGRELEGAGVDKLWDAYVLRPARGAMDYYKGRPVPRVVNDFFGENEDETGRVEEEQSAEPPADLARPYEASSMADAMAHVLEQSHRCVSPMAVKLKGMPKGAVGRFIKRVFAAGTANCASGWVEGDTLHLRFSYSDDTRIKACHSGFLRREELTARERLAYDKALRIVKQVQAEHTTEYRRAVALHDYLVLHSRYDKKKLRKVNGAACTLLLEGSGVCNAYMRSYSILLHILGVENEYITGGGHGWNMVKLENEWTHVDVTWDDPVPDKPGRVLHQWFGMTDKQIRKSHRWSRSVYTRRATSEKLYYPNR